MYRTNAVYFDTNTDPKQKHTGEHMSAALTDLVESLHTTAARKLLELIDREKDPILLARLIATALRFKVSTPAKRPQATQSPAEGDAADEAEYTPPPPRPYTQDEYADLIRRHGSADAMDMREKRDALVARYRRNASAAARTG